MAGVGFELRKLFADRTAVGQIKAYSYSAVITAGPFALLTLMVLVVQAFYSFFDVDESTREQFVAYIVYAFIFSQVISSGFTMVLTRYIADCLSVARWNDVTASMLGMGAILSIIGGVIVTIYYWGTPLPFLSKILAYLFFALLMFVWTEGVYLSAIKRYMRLMLGYAGGMVTSSIMMYVLLKYADDYFSADQAGLLALVIGMTVIAIAFLLLVTAHFGLPNGALNFAFLPYFERHYRLFFSSFFHMLGTFIPNMIIWFGPLGVVAGNSHRYAPVYDILTFYAFLSILPMMMLFVVAVETNFYEKYSLYFTAVTRKGNFHAIDNARRNLLHTMWFELRHVVEYQLVFTLVWLALGSYLLNFAGITYAQINMFNVILFGTFFVGILQLIYILLIYFDYQKDVMIISLLYVILNVVLGLVGFEFIGEMSYGFTFFLAAAISCAVGLWRLNHFAKRINYFVFCSQPVFYRPPNGILTKFTLWLYGERYVNLELLGTEKEEENERQAVASKK
ncbi:MAG: exopolysaccharide Pel transporter PelG [Schwartzia sp.]|nr:exopolysaccharide Pel transporter PelG [Schwartzia sp. (in: firmicutes)]